jgi:hypothetical protein
MDGEGSASDGDGEGEGEGESLGDAGLLGVDCEGEGEAAGALGDGEEPPAQAARASNKERIRANMTVFFIVRYLLSYNLGMTVKSVA